MDKKWFESLVKTKIEKVLHVEVNVNATTILCLAIAFGLLLLAGLTLYCVYRCKAKKPKQKNTVPNNSISEVACNGQQSLSD